MKIAVGSRNDAKLAGVEVAAQQSFSESVTVSKEDADSQVSPMPTS